MKNNNMLDPEELIPVEELEDFGFGSDEIKMFPTKAFARIDNQRYVKRAYLRELGFAV